MAIKITTDCIVRSIRPSARKFNLDELNEHTNSFIEPTKIGPVWIMYGEHAKDNGEPLNKVASYFFDIALYGTVLVVPPHQLPSEWDLMEPEDYRYTAEDIDNGFLLSLQTSLINKRLIDNATPDVTGSTKIARVTPKTEWTYKPTKEVDESVEKFYDQVYDFINKNPELFKSNIIMSDRKVIVKIESVEDRIEILNQMINIFVEKEEYEKCAILQKNLDECENLN